MEHPAAEQNHGLPDCPETHSTTRALASRYLQEDVQVDNK